MKWRLRKYFRNRRISQSRFDFLKQSSDDKIRQEFQVVFGSGGPVEYFYRLCKNIKTKYPDFLPEV